MYAYIFNFAERVQRLHERRIIFHCHAQRDTGHLAPVRIATESRSADAPILFLSQIAKFLCLFVNGRRADMQAGLLESLFLSFTRAITESPSSGAINMLTHAETRPE